MVRRISPLKWINTNQNNEKDAAFLYQITDKLMLDVGRQDLFGSLGNYHATAAHGPFIHVDVRGTRPRWGL